MHGTAAFDLAGGCFACLEFGSGGCWRCRRWCCFAGRWGEGRSLSLPTAENFSLVTERDVLSARGAFRVDPRGDTGVSHHEAPGAGAVTLAEEGSACFTYTPYETSIHWQIHFTLRGAGPSGEHISSGGGINSYTKIENCRKARKCWTFAEEFGKLDV